MQSCRKIHRFSFQNLEFIDDDPAGFYKKDAGPYWFQKEGSPKFLNDAGGILGFTGSQVDPVKALKGMELGRR
jgi:hypothetical protein